MSLITRLALLLGCIIPAYTKAQIINVETARIYDTTGFFGDINAHVLLNKNVSQVFELDFSSSLLYKTKKDMYLLLGSYGFLKAAGENLIDNSFLHARYNRKIGKWLRWEVFTQLQSNVVNGIDSRFLVGTGPRNKIIERKFIKLYIAALLMYEYEKEATDEQTTHKNFRNSSYVALTLLPKDYLQIVNTLFYQPLLKDFADYRVLNQTSVKVKAGKRLSLSLNWNYLFDSRPVISYPKVNYSLSTAIGYEF
jgi:hypothetical protein